MNGCTKEAIINLLSKNCDERSVTEVNAIVPLIQWRTNCLKNVDRDVVCQLLQRASHMVAAKDDIIVRQGERGESFYIILKGLVSVYVDPCLSEDNDTSAARSKATAKEKKSDDTRTHDLENKSAKATESLPGDMQLISTTNRVKFGHCVCKLGSDQDFGELALLRPDNRRNATIIADQATDLLVIPFTLYNTTLKAQQKKEYDRKKAFVENHPLFSDWHADMQNTLLLALRSQVYEIGQCIYLQGEPVTGLHFLERGKAKISVEPLRHYQQFPNILAPSTGTESFELPPDADPVEQVIAKMRRPRTLEPIESNNGKLVYMKHHTFLKRSEGYTAAEKQIFQKIVDLCVVEEGELLNDIEIASSLEHYLFTTNCISECQVYTLSNFMYRRLQEKRPTNTSQLIQWQAEIKLKRRMASTQGAKVPILPLLHLPLFQQISEAQSRKEKREERKKSKAGANLDPIEAGNRTAKASSITNKKYEPYSTQKTNKLLTSWYLQDKAPMIQPITNGTIAFRDIMMKRYKRREQERLRKKEPTMAYSYQRQLQDTKLSLLRNDQRMDNIMRRINYRNQSRNNDGRWKV